MDAETEHLVARTKAKDAAAIEALLQRHVVGLEAYVRLQAGQLVRAKESVADLVQSVCREVLEDMDDFEYRGEHAFRRFLFQRALHKITDKHRHYTAQKRDAARERELAQTTQAGLLECYRTLATPSRELAMREAIERIEQAFQKLSPEHRTAITLHRIVGLTQAETAAEMGKTEGSVRMMIYRGLARLGVLLAQQEES